METLHNLHDIDTQPGELGVTVRNGLKWSALVCPGDPIALCVCGLPGADFDHTVVGTGRVTQVETYAFKDVPARAVEHEHESAARCYSGLLSSMRRAYGPNFGADSPVTVLWYQRLT